MKKIIIPISIIIIVLTVSILGISLIVNNNDTELVQNTVEEISTVEETTSVEETTEEPTTVYEDIVGHDKYITNADRGNSKGEIVENTIEYADITTETASLNGQLDTEKQDFTITEETEKTAEDYEEGEYYIIENEDGSREYSPYLITDLLADSRFAGYSADQIEYFLDNYMTYEKNDIQIRSTLEMVSTRSIKGIISRLEKETGSTSNTGSMSSSNSSSSTGSSTSQQTQQPVVEPSQPETPSQPVVEQPSQPSGGFVLSQEEMDAIAAENEAAGRVAGDGSDFGGDTGESWSDGRKYN